MYDINGQGKMSHRSVCRWVAQFHASKQDLKDAALSGCPPTTTTKHNIKKITDLLNQDAQYTVRDLAWLANFSLAPVHCILTLFQTTNFQHFQTERVYRRQFQIGWKCLKVFQMGRKHCGKRRNCLLQAISPFPEVFSKDLYGRHIKTRACLEKG